VRIVAGSAKHQLAGDESQSALHERGIVYAPDFIVMRAPVKRREELTGYDESQVNVKIGKLYSRILSVLETSKTGRADGSSRAGTGGRALSLLRDVRELGCLTLLAWLKGSIVCLKTKPALNMSVTFARGQFPDLLRRLESFSACRFSAPTAARSSVRQLFSTVRVPSSAELMRRHAAGARMRISGASVRPQDPSSTSVCGLP